VRGLVGLCLISACGFSTGTPNGNSGDDGVAPDASADAAPEIDASVVPLKLPLYAASHQMLYEIDVDLKTSKAVGPIKPVGLNSVDVDGLALFGQQLIGISDGGDSLLKIDRLTGTITSTVPLTPAGTWAGLTVIPAGDLEATPVVLAGTPSDGKLYRIDPDTGAVTMVGSFTSGYTFFTDLAWVHGSGLYATLTSGNCASVCFAKINPATGSAVAFRTTLGTNLYGMSGYRDRLWAFNNAGPVLSVDRTTGTMAIELDPQIAWTEAAQ
jgi:hypothetical protein